MNWNEKLYSENEKPLDNLVSGYSHTSVFRKIAFIGDSLSSGEFETCDRDGNKAYHDLYEYSWGQYIARKNGLTAFNFSRGGMTASEFIESFGEANDLISELFSIASNSSLVGTVTGSFLKLKVITSLSS